jgi:hypothetical protein
MTTYEAEMLQVKRNENALKAIELKGKSSRTNSIYDKMLNRILYESGFDIHDERLKNIRNRTS